MGLLVSAQEPSAIRALGTVSAAAEVHGSDVLFVAHGKLWGLQRKAWGDLIASVHDGRLQEELARMSLLAYRMLLVEGEPRWQSDGSWANPWGRRWTRSQYRALLYSVRDNGFWVEQTDDLTDTVEAIRGWYAWAQKESHKTLGGARPGPAGSPWGRVTSRDWARHLMTSFPGVGPELADRIIDHFSGVPLVWTCTEAELRAIPGLGPKTAARLIGALRTTPGNPSNASPVGR